MVTIKMIAKECGFSIATVSKALNGAPDVSAETKETIRKWLPKWVIRQILPHGC